MTATLREQKNEFVLIKFIKCSKIAFYRKPFCL